MTQKNIIIGALVIVGILILFSFTGRQYAPWGMMGWMHDDAIYEEMIEHMHDDSNHVHEDDDGHFHNEMGEHMHEIFDENGDAQDTMLDEMREHMGLDESDEGILNNNVPTSADNAPPGSMHNLPVPEAVASVKAKVAAELGISAGTVIVMSAYEQEWSDGCLGLGGPAESCIAVITPGYEVTVLAQGNERVFRTNVDGFQIREEK